MTSEKQALGPIGRGTRHLKRLALLELSAGRLLVLSAAVGVSWAASLFDWSFVIGAHPFWRFPKGTIPGSQYDMAQVLTAYFYYLQSPWHLPLFYVSALGTPSGTNIILMDAVPVVALTGKLIRGIIGTMPNLFGAYLFLCFAHLHRILGIFRSSGRFFWLIGYAQIAIVIVLAFRQARPLIAFCFTAAAILQVCDVQPLRAQLIASIAAEPSPTKLDPDQVAHLIGGARHVEVVPSFQCSSNGDQGQANMELMLATARANVPTNTVDLARQSGLSIGDVLRAPFRVDEMLKARLAAYCEQEVEQTRRRGLAGDVFVLLSDQPRPPELSPDIICSPISWARFCNRKE